jgi:type I restriction enzyme S subunit
VSETGRKATAFDSATEDEIPEGWTTTGLPDVAEIIMGQSPPGSSYNKAGSGLPFFQGKADFGARSPTARAWCTEPSRVVQPGDILISVRAPVGPTNLADQRCAVGRGLSAIRPRGGVPSLLVLYALRLQEEELAEKGTESTFTAINRDDLEAVSFPLPPLAEQNRIVAKVEKLLARVDASRARLARVPAVLKHFRQAVLAAACEGRLTEEWRGAQATFSRVVGEETESTLAVEFPKSWRWLKAASLCDPARALTYGVIKLGPPVARGIPTLRSSNVRPLFIDTSEVKCISKEIASEYSRTTLRGEEVLITVRGTLGGIAVAKPEMNGWNVSREVAVLPVLPDRCDPNYLVIAIASRGCQYWLMERAKGVAYTGINIEDLKLLPVPIPTLLEQREVVRRVEALFKLADAVEKRVATARARADNLTQAILARAFRGELVPTEAELARRVGRGYETATELLERIRGQRAVTAGRAQRQFPRPNVR